MFGISEKLERITKSIERQTVAVERYMDAAVESHREAEKANIASRHHAELATKIRETELEIRRLELEAWKKKS